MNFSPNKFLSNRHIHEHGQSFNLQNLSNQIDFFLLFLLFLSTPDHLHA